MDDHVAGLVEYCECSWDEHGTIHGSCGDPVAGEILAPSWRIAPREATKVRDWRFSAGSTITRLRLA
ncbi:hypothetical protein TIFTF001_009187 [Ficus carica]|uniref:Uncharacterized protein n=1 Tax=Ficus carica TaxID=3494 RepID=A0AA88A6B6_FICCA|nr:hypothetical protein TIFTF001_009187 [Ficus carica]